MAARSAVPIQHQPGKLLIPSTGAVIEQTIDWDDAFFDTSEFTTFAQGKKEPFNLQDYSGSKKGHHTNITESRKIPSRYVFKILRIGVHVRQMAGSVAPDPRDVIALYEMCTMEFKINTNLVTKGPLLRYQSGYGVTGPSTASDISTLHLGVPSAAAAPKLRKTHDITERDSLNVTLEIDIQTWLTQNSGQPTMQGSSVLVSVFCDGSASRPLGT